MQIYLPIAEMAVNPALMLGIGLSVGAISGIFGVGGGFLLTPLLILVGIPANIAVVAGADVSAASSMATLMANVERKTLDFKMGLVVSIAGVIGVSLGAALFRYLQSFGFAEPFVRLSYVVLLSYVGFTLLNEALRALAFQKAPDTAPQQKSKRSSIAYKLPLKMRFGRSKLYISVIPPIILGLVIGALSSILGIGGGFLLVPALVYLLNMPPSLVVGTSSFQVLIMAAMTTFVQANATSGLDLILTCLLIFGAVAGAQIGSLFGQKLKGEQLRLLLGSIISILALVLASQLFFKPASLFDISSAGGGL